MTSSVYSISAALLKASANVQVYARQVELRGHELARKAVAELDDQVSP